MPLCAAYAAIDADGPEVRLLDSLNLKYKLVQSPLDALQGDAIAVVKATPANLRLLAAQGPKVESFCRGGGWLMLWGLTPDGLADYNRIVGHEHVIRPFQMERVLLGIPRDPLTAGLTLRDVVMDTVRGASIGTLNLTITLSQDVDVRRCRCVRREFAPTPVARFSTLSCRGMCAKSYAEPRMQ